MSKSLNQAFIRAYSKEKTSRPAPPPPAAVSEQLDQQFDQQLNERIEEAGLIDYVVRFDTATCGIPAPHTPAVNRSRGMPQESLPVASGPSRASGRLPARAVAASPAPVEVVPGPQDAAALRSAIAEQMTRAGEWDGSATTDFPGGYPMLSQRHHRTATVRSVPIQSQAIPAHARPPQVHPPQVHPPQFSSPQVPNPGSPSIGGSNANNPSSHNNPASQPSGALPRHGFLDASSVKSTPDGLSGHSLPSRSSSSPEVSKREAESHERRPELNIRSPQFPKREIHAPSLQSPVLLSHQTNSEDFFRLDRPSYSPAPAVRASEEFSDSGDSGSQILGLSDSQVNLEPSDMATPTEPVSQSATKIRQDAAHAAKIEQVQLAERELRRSKLKVFNPVWEVDSFQWPDVCLALLEQRSEVLEAVAGNLNEAVQEGLQVLAITSPRGGEGRTTVACCLAKLVGSRGLNVAIVDGDIDNPTLSYQTNLDIHQDWKSAILDQLPLEEIAVHSIDDQVTLVPLIGAIDDSELSVDDNRIESMLHELSESFDLVIVDMGHMNSPRSLVSSLCARGVISAVVAVVDHRTSDAQEIDHCLRSIRQAGVASIGVVENFAA